MTSSSSYSSPMLQVLMSSVTGYQRDPVTYSLKYSLTVAEIQSKIIYFTYCNGRYNETKIILKMLN